MDSRDHEAPELAPHSYPELTQDDQQQQYLQQQQHFSQQYYNTQSPISKPEQSPSPHPVSYSQVDASTYGGQLSPSPYIPETPAELPEDKGRPRTICGCTSIVFLLCCIIALLAAAVIGLAAGTGVEANRANNATNQLLAISSSLAQSATKTVSTPAATTTAFNSLDDGCSNNPSGITGSQYTSFALLGGLQFTIYCNKDTPHNPIMSLFTADINTCMDACAAYSKYIPTNFGNSTKTTCFGVSFIPLWTTKAGATAGTAPGNCYLKPGPINETSLTTPNIGTEVHAGILT